MKLNQTAEKLWSHCTIVSNIVTPHRTSLFTPGGAADLISFHRKETMKGIKPIKVHTFSYSKNQRLSS